MGKPSCHGDASVFSFASKTCTACKSFDSCVGMTHDALLELKPTQPVLALVQRHERYRVLKKQFNAAEVISGVRKLTDAESLYATTLPVKTASQYRRIVSQGYVHLMHVGLANRTNPFSIDGFKYLHIAFNALLRGGFTKRELRQQYMTLCGWTEGTAFSAVSIVWHLFPACRVAKAEANALRPMRNVNTDH